MNLSTYSIVARDSKTGYLAVAGGTNWFCYGRWVLHIEAGFGSLATQAQTNMWYAPNGLENLKKGLSAEDTLKDLLKRDPDKGGIYQLLIIDNVGRTACYTGKANHHYAGQILDNNFGVAGNTLVSEKTLQAVFKFYKNSKLSFTLKIIKALQEGQKAGGDIRGMKSAALKVAKGKSSGKYWEDIIYDLRVDESRDPLKELERLYYIAEAYGYIDKAESAININKSLVYYQKALKLDPDNEEIMFWIARNYNVQGNKNESDKIMKKLRKGKGKWEEYWRRLD